MKRIIATIVCIALLLTSNSVCIKKINADDTRENVIILNENQNIEDMNNNYIENAEAVVVSNDIEEQNKDALNEVMDNGTGIIVQNDSIEDVKEYFDTDETSDYKNEMGCLVYKDGEDVNIVPLEAQILVEENADETISKDDYEELLDEDIIDYEKVMEDYYNLSSEEKITELEEDTLAKLQGSTDIGSSFMDNDKFVYFFKKGSAGGVGTTYKYSTKSAIDGWSRMGSLSFSIYAIKIKTIKNTTYDNVFSVVVATSYKDKYVIEFRTGLSYNDTKKCSIIDYADPDKDTDQKVSLGTGVDSEGKISVTTSYSYNPKKLDITTTMYENRVRWTCNPQSAILNGSWRVNPGILLKKTDGKDNSVKMSSYVSYFQISGGIRTYTITDTQSCSITFKNHKKA